MPKRFTETTKWTNNKWFFNLSVESKLFWIYLLDSCDNVGVWEENIGLANKIIGYEYSLDTLLEDFEKQIFVFKNNRKWWIIDFCEFQYGILNENTTSKPIQSYIFALKKHTLWNTYLKGIHTLKEKEKKKDKEKDKDTDKEKEYVSELENSNELFEKITFALWNLFDKNMERYGVKSTDLSKAKANKWITDVRRMFEIDKRTKEDFILIFNFLRDEQPSNSGFAWSMNIRSTENLRKNFEKILVKAKNNKQEGQEYDMEEINNLMNNGNREV